MFFFSFAFFFFVQFVCVLFCSDAKGVNRIEKQSGITWALYKRYSLSFDSLNYNLLLVCVVWTNFSHKPKWRSHRNRIHIRYKICLMFRLYRNRRKIHRFRCEPKQKGKFHHYYGHQEYIVQYIRCIHYFLVFDIWIVRILNHMCSEYDEHTHTNIHLSNT